MIRSILAGLAGAALCGAPSLAAGDHPLLEAGASAFDNLCSHCHGKEMVNPGTSSFDLRKFPRDDEKRFFESVLNGKGDMPAWKDVLIDGELESLWVYVATRGGKEPMPEDESPVGAGTVAQAETAEAVAKAAASDIEGEEVAALVETGSSAYDTLCSHCHGKKMVNPGTSSFDLRKFPVDQKARFFDSVLNGKGDMPAWKDVLIEGELDAIWTYVATRGGAEPYPGDQSALPPEPGRLKAELMTPGALTVCLARNGGALSGWRSSGGTGLDYRLAERLAAHLGLALDVTWYETEAEEESDPVRETYALLSEPLCDLAAEQPLYENAVGPPRGATASLPRWDDRPDWWGTRQTALKPIAATTPYMRAEIGLVLGPGVEGEVGGLSDIGDRVLGLQQGTLSGAIALTQAPADVLARARTFNPGPKFLWDVEIGKADVAIVDVAAFDFHRKQNRVTKLRLASWRHPFGVNIGFAVAAEDVALLAAVSGFVDEARETGAIAEIAAAEGVTWGAPRPPWMTPPVTRATLAALR